MFLGSYGDILIHRSDCCFVLIWRHKATKLCLGKTEVMILREVLMPLLFNTAVNNFLVKTERVAGLIFILGYINVGDCLLDS